MERSITVIMPTYNDEDYIESAVKSALDQRDINLQLIVVDDGSTDNTPRIVTRIKDRRLVYLRQENMGQLNAIFNAIRYVKGDYVTLLHSDDMFTDKYALARSVDELEKTGADAANADLVKIDAKGKTIGIIKTASISDERRGKLAVKEILARLGSNIVSDIFISRRSFFFRNIVKNYVVWNMPYWIIFGKDAVRAARVAHLKEPWYKYRVYSGNYVATDVGRFVALNGVVRTIVWLSRYIKAFLPAIKMLPLSRTSRFASIFTRYMTPPMSVLDKRYRRQVAAMIELALLKYKLSDRSKDFYNSICRFYLTDRKKILNIDYEVRDPIFLGKDVRLFYKLMDRGEIPPVYSLLLSEAKKGFFAVRTPKYNEGKIRNILNFLNLQAPVIT